MVNGICGLKDHYTVRGIEFSLYGIESLLCLSGLLTYACKYAEALGLDVDLAFFAVLASYLAAVRIICSYEPFSVPSRVGIEKDLVHLRNGCANL